MKIYFLRAKAKFFAVVVTILLGALLLVNARSNTKGNINDSLVNAVRGGDASLVKAELMRGADPNTRLKPPGYWSGIMSDEEAGDEPSREPTVLMLAAMRGNIATTKILLDDGANINLKDNMGNTVFDWASGHPEVVQYIKKYASGFR